MLEKTAELSEEYMARSNLVITKKALALPQFTAAKCVYIYHSIGNEVDTHKLISYCNARNKSYALPRVFPGGDMVFALVSPIMELERKPPYNIPEPPHDAPIVSPCADDVVIVPGVCYDIRGYRIGHGGGYYDRYLQSCPATTIGLCREELILPVIPAEAHDVPVNILVSEKEVRNP